VAALKTDLDHEAVIVGSGFGGAVMCARLSKRCPGLVLLLERGKAYPLGGFPRSPHDLANNVWYPDGDGARRPPAVHQRRARRRSLTGMYGFGLKYESNFADTHLGPVPLDLLALATKLLGSTRS